MQSHFCVESLCNICDVSLFVTNYVFPIMPLIFTFWRFHIFEADSSFNEPHKNYFFIDLRESFDLKSHFSEVAITSATK